MLGPLVRKALSDPAFVTEIRLDAVNRRGRPISLRLVCSALRCPDGQERGAPLVMKPVE